MDVTYEGTYKTLPTPTRTGYTFGGWFNENGNEEGTEEITAETVVEITDDQTLYAHWDETLSSQIGIMFGKKDMSEEEIRKIMGFFTDAEFTIETNDAGETIIIIKFVDDTKAEEFFRNIVNSSNSEKDFIRIAYSSSKVDVSISTMVYPFILFGYLLI